MLNRPSRSLRRIAGSTSAIALATALVVPAQAQSINAPAPTVVSGNATYNTTGTLDTITINSNTAVLDFTPNDTGVGGGPINFQNAGTTLRFDRVGQDFTVLNRIVPADPTRAIQFNGTVESRIVSTITNPGGSVWFYSPGGIILGAGASFNVGSLLLSTADPTGGSGTITSTNVFNLSSVANSNAAVTIQPGAQIKALNEGSYVALVAPVVSQAGSVRVNGSAAFVAAEQASLTINQGLFDIDVVVGSDGGGTPLTHTGSTSGPASTGGAFNAGTDNHGIYMVAVPKNSAITMLIAPDGQLGFDAAASATIENGAIYLRTADIVGLKAVNKVGARMQGDAAAPALADIDLTLNKASNLVSSPIEAQATTELNVALAGSTKFAGDASLYSGAKTIVGLASSASLDALGIFAVSAYTAASGGTATFEALAGSQANFAVALGVSSNEGGLFNQYGAATTRAFTGGTATIRASGATITANGSGNIGGGGGSRTTLITRASTADGTGVSRLIIDQGGKVQAVGAAGEIGVRISASPTIGKTGVPRAGGTATINVDDGQLITDSIFVDAPSFGNGDTLLGGLAQLNIGPNGGTVSVTKSLFLNATVTATPPTAGLPSVSATGGTARLSTSASTKTASITADTITLDAGASFDPGSDPSTLNGGKAAGGLAEVAIGAGGNLNATTSITMTTVARGSAGVAGGDGGSATQGDIRLGAFDGAAISFGAAKLDADTFGGAGGTAASTTTAGGTGGAAIKGPGASLFAGGGATITGGKTQVLAIARSGVGGDGLTGGFAGAGGAAEAGSAVISTDTGGKITLGDTSILAGTSSGATGVGSANGVLVSGPALGGSATLNAKAGTIELASLVLATDAIGGKGLATGASGGTAIGGNSFVGANGGGSLKVGATNFAVNSGAAGGAAGFGGEAGGAATAGTVNIDGSGGAITFETASLLNTAVGGRGGDGPTTTTAGGTGGAATGGTVFLTAGAGTITGKSTNILASVDAGDGGDGFSGTGLAGSGAAATGSTININTSAGGQIKLTTVTADGRALGGNTSLGVGDATTTGGAGKGGSLNIGTGTGLIEMLDLDAPLEAFSGNGFATGSDAGDAVGGAGNIFAQAGGTFRVTTGEFYVSTTANAGNNSGGGDKIGGNATGGTIFVGGEGAIEALGTDLTLEASAFAGDYNVSSAGGSGGKAVAGFAQISTSGTLTVAGSTVLLAIAEGGNTASLSGGTGGNAFGGKTFIGAQKGDGTLVDAFLDAQASGGSAAGTSTGGAGVGGRARISTGAFGPIGTGGSTLTFADGVSMIVEGDGGASAAGTGGAGYGGQAPITGLSTQDGGIEIHTLGGAITVSKFTSFSARGTGGSGATGGLGSAGRGNLIAFSGDIKILDTINASMVGLGGTGASDLGGNGTGGNFSILTQDGGFGVPAGTPASVTVQSVSSSNGGLGGQGLTGGGIGQGGVAFIQALAAQNKIAVQGNVNFNVSGTGGFYNGSGAGSGGLGQGGSASVSGKLGALTLAQGVSIQADGFGGSASSASQGNGGEGRGGSAFYFANQGTVTQADGSIFLSADGVGGDAGALGIGGTGGLGTGGFATLDAFNGGVIDSKATNIFLDANGDGGSVSGTGNGSGGMGQGGTARVQADNGSLTLRSSVDVSADGFGGFGEGTGNGGTGRGGHARAGTNGGLATNKLAITGDLDINASGSGGGTDQGGGGQGVGGSPPSIETGPFNQGAYLVAIGGEVSIGGVTSLVARGLGGIGLAGGTGLGGLANLVAFGSTITAAGVVSLDSSGQGGSGSFSTGGSGGQAFGGSAFIAATSGGDSQGGGVVPLGTPSSIVLGQTVLVATGQGGDGGVGAVGAAGGAGGNGAGGTIRALAQAGSGQLTTGQLLGFIQGVGGDGGTGGVAASPGASGGAGGKGGDGTGGFTNFGTASGPDTTVNNGSATFEDVSFFINGVGGMGGDGTDGGQGGDGGLGAGGGGGLISRGSPVTATTVSVDSGGFGGQAGVGSGATPVSGAPGEGRGGSAGVMVTNRFNRTERGSFTAISFSASAVGLGGFDGGLNFGPSTAGQAFAQVSKGDVALDTLSLISSGTLPTAAGLETFIKVDNGVLEATTISASTTGDLLVSIVDGGVLRSDFVSLNATGSLLPPLAGAPGLIDVATEFSALLGKDFVTTADFNVTGTFSINAEGQIQVGNVTSGGDIDLLSTGPMTVGNLTAGEGISLVTEGFLTAGDLIAGTNAAPVSNFVTLEGSTGVKVGNIKGISVDIDDGIATDSIFGITTGDIVAEGISISSTKDVTLGKVTQGDIYPTSDFDTFGDVFLSAEGTLTTLAIDALGGANLFGGTAISTAAITSGNDIFIGSDGNVSTGNLTAGLANLSTTSGAVDVFVFGSIALGDIKAATIDFQVGDPAAPVSAKAGNLTAETISLDVGGTMVVGDVTTADIYSNIDTSIDNFLIGIGVLGDVKTGAVDAFTSVGIGSVTGKVETGAIKANDSVMLLAATSVATGGIAAGTDLNDSIFISNTSIIQSNPDFAVLQDFDELGGEFDINVLRTAAPVRTGAAITITGPVSAANFAAATSQGFNSGAITAPGRLFLNVGGTITGGALSTGTDLILSSDQSIDVGNLTASNVDLTSKQSVTLGAVNSSGIVLVNAGSLANINGQVSGSSIQITSSDIAIAPGAGLNGSFSITLVSTGGPTRLGGSADGSGYILDRIEAQGLRASSIEFRNSGSITLGELTLQGSGGANPNLVGTNGRLLVNASAGSAIQVTGAVSINNATAGNQLTLNSGEGLSVNTDNGSIGMFGSSSGVLAGTLQLQSTNVRVASSTLLGQLPSLSAAQRQTALATPPSGSPRPEGYLQAGRIEFRANELLIQNSNTAAQFGGFSAGSGGAVLRGFSGNQADAIIFGRIADSSGSFKINQEAVPLLTLTDGEGAPSTVTSTSLFNNCPFTGACGTVVPPPPPPPPEEEPVSEMVAPVPVNVLAIVEDVLSSTSDPETVAALPTVNLVTTIDTGALRTEPLITDPVTGGGNPSLWEAAPQGSDDERRPAQGPGDEE